MIVDMQSTGRVPSESGTSLRPLNGGRTGIGPGHGSARSSSTMLVRPLTHMLSPHASNANERRTILAPPSSPRSLTHREVEEMMHSLVDEHGEWHPENWIPRAEHPALPPRPTLWYTPRTSSAHLPSTALQLNPYLSHRLFGRPPILLDMRDHLIRAQLGQLEPATPGEEPKQ